MAKRKLGKFKCNKCDRVFAMPAHLARHQAASHGAPGRKAAAGRRGALGGLFKAPPAMLSASPLLDQMQDYRNQLMEQRSQMDSQIEAIEQAMHMLGAAAQPRTGGRGRASRAGTLRSHIEGVLQKNGRAMSVKDITDGVLKAGFATKNKALDKSVGVTLTKMNNVRKVARGVFNLK